MKHARDADQLIRVATAAVVTAVGGVAAVVSFSHIFALAREHGQSGTAARLLPLSVDGLILAASLVLLHEARNSRDAPVLARGMIVLGVAATVAANVAYGLPFGLAGAVVSAWPAVAFVGSVEMMMGLIRSARRGAAPAAVLGTPPPGVTRAPGSATAKATPEAVSSAMEEPPGSHGQEPPGEPRPVPPEEPRGEPAAGAPGSAPEAVSSAMEEPPGSHGQEPPGEPRPVPPEEPRGEPAAGAPGSAPEAVSSAMEEPPGSHGQEPPGERRERSRRSSKDPEADRARRAYRKSVRDGEPLTDRALGEMFSRSRTWGAARIGEAKSAPSLAEAR